MLSAKDAYAESESLKKKYNAEISPIAEEIYKQMKPFLEKKIRQAIRNNRYLIRITLKTACRKVRRKLPWSTKIQRYYINYYTSKCFIKYLKNFGYTVNLYNAPYMRYWELTISWDKYYEQDHYILT